MPASVYMFGACMIAIGWLPLILYTCWFAWKYEMAHKMNDLHDLEQLSYKFKGLENKIIKMKYMDVVTLSRIAIELNYSADYIK